MIVGITLMFFIVGLCGCLGNNENNTNGSNSNTNGSNHKTVTMNASELRKDLHNEGSYSSEVEVQNYARYYDSVDEGDTLVIVDYVTEIYYWAEKDKTRIDLSDPTVGFYFNGNVENSYDVGDEVRVTVTIKHVELSYTSNGRTLNYDVEIFEEQWVNEQYFIENKFGAPLPTSCIEIVV